MSFVSYLRRSEQILQVIEAVLINYFVITLNYDDIQFAVCSAIQKLSWFKFSCDALPFTVEGI